MKNKNVARDRVIAMLEQLHCLSAMGQVREIRPCRWHRPLGRRDTVLLTAYDTSRYFANSHISAVLDAHSITIASDGLLGRMPLAMALYAAAVGSDAV